MDDDLFFLDDDSSELLVEGPELPTDIALSHDAALDFEIMDLDEEDNVIVKGSRENVACDYDEDATLLRDSSDAHISDVDSEASEERYFYNGLLLHYVHICSARRSWDN